MSILAGLARLERAICRLGGGRPVQLDHRPLETDMGIGPIYRRLCRPSPTTSETSVMASPPRVGLGSGASRGAGTDELEFPARQPNRLDVVRRSRADRQAFLPQNSLEGDQESLTLPHG